MEDERERGRDKFIGTAKSELDLIENDILSAEEMAKGDSNPETVSAWTEIAELARKRKELFMAEHDQAGAFKLKKFDRQVRDFFFANENEGRKQVIESDEEGMYQLAKGQENRRLLFVDLLDLARLNKKGGQKAGDMGLEKTIETLKEEIQGRLEKKKGSDRFKFDIFRFSGNQIMVSFDGISEDECKEIAAVMTSQSIDVSDKLGKEVEPAPLYASTMNFEDLVEDLNVLQAGMSDRFSPGADAGREVMSALLRGAEWRSDIGKFTTYAERVVEKLGTDPAEAAEYFEKFVKKNFSGSRFEKIEDIKAMVDANTLGVGPDMGELIRTEAIKSVKAKFDKDRKLGDTETDHLERGMRKVITSERIKARWRDPESDDLTPGERPTEDQKTAGEVVLAEKKQAYLKAESDYKIIVRSKGPASVEAAKSRLQFENAQLDLQIETARRNVGTGLLERGVYYEDLESKLETNEDLTTVFVDMGFLKYFDEDGGKDVGDRALLTAARLMERAVKEAGLKGEVYRYGGDEFSVVLNGSKDDAAKFEAKLTELKKLTGVIPRGPKSKSAYIPTEIQFNTGVSNREDLNDALAASGREGASLNRQAQIMTDAADVGVKYRKSLDRINLLVDMLRRQAGGEVTPDIRAKLDRSAKVTEPKKGGELLILTLADEVRMAANLPIDEREAIYQEIQERITTFVLNDLEAKRLEEKDGSRLLDEFIEAKTKAEFLEGQLARLALSSKADKLTIKDMKKRLKVAQDEVEQMRGIRASLAA